MKFILGHKGEMTQQFADSGAVVPVTRVAAGPCVITQIKAEKKDGYSAIQIGFGARKKISKPLAGHLKDLGKFQYLKEFRVAADEAQKFAVGDTITTDVFQIGDIVRVTGTSKGKGFQGVVRRHHFSGSPATHGHKDQLRMPGSVASTGPAHVFKGTRMGGQMGGEQVTITNLEIVAVNPEKQELLVKGAIPGRRGGLVFITGPGELTAKSGQKNNQPVVVPAQPAAADKPEETQPEVVQ